MGSSPGRTSPNAAAQRLFRCFLAFLELLFAIFAFAGFSFPELLFGLLFASLAIEIRPWDELHRSRRDNVPGNVADARGDVCEPSEPPPVNSLRRCPTTRQRPS